MVRAVARGQPPGVGLPGVTGLGGTLGVTPAALAAPWYFFMAVSRAASAWPNRVRSPDVWAAFTSLMARSSSSAAWATEPVTTGGAPVGVGVGVACAVGLLLGAGVGVDG